MSIRMRHTSGHTGNRRSHHALRATNVVKDKESGNLRLPHHLDEATGMYRGKQIFTPKVKRVHESKAKGPSTEPVVAKHIHEHAQETHANAEAKSTKGIFGKIATGGRPKARSGFGGGV
ncbi:50S ribosomal protein L32 [Candidatus Kaiserbacteria bacterium RIFCSPLOWO2_01_FULL_52_12b]|uniref:Large ribosomal subunit protein bL32 n=1 Tax=Candidatus Kaiserbacteria bacterium RIFCSPLOWO2_01_FULL_52_12b TaxID=1798509 RepID=A0A1F6EX34_9BACT|nr:MAG: 50S ribosomal protein L32 [Candidatus Kaiserbacteria bacterium RIFCSPLOWO2_01_FULL_52_12b]